MASTSTSTTGSKRKNEVKGAFHEFAPSATTSASKRIKKPSYDVFINHRGPDVKHTLASVLYSMLTGMALSVFLDSEELNYGDFLPQAIEAAMKGALLHIAIFSMRYAESPWCLAELSFMLKSGATIIPIFYHVDPTDLRYIDKGKGIYVDAFNKHEQKGRYSMELLQEWKEALRVVSYYDGHIIETNEDEMRLLKNIVRCVLKEINNDGPLVVAKHPVGLREIVQDFEMNTLQSAQCDEDVQIVGIWGMGGSGKTTLAKELYNNLSSSMERSSFVFDVRDAATKGLLHEKQKKLLNDLGVQGSAFDNIEEGMGALSRRLRSARVLIVLDDVDNVEQLDALLPTKDSLESGSLIIVTTREHGVLRSWGITSIYKMKPLAPLYAKQLFCWHAFLQSSPQDGFEKLVENFLKACQGLPLSLKVFGGQLYGESRKEYWESLLHNISRILSNDIRKKLKVSYDALNFEEKHMFLDTACFLIGEESGLAIEIWNGLGWSGLYSWERLLNKCLVEVDSKNLIRMHDHLRDLGKEIANQESPYRLVLPQQIIDVPKYQEKRIGIRGIRATSSQIRWVNYQGVDDSISSGMTGITWEVEKEIFPVMEKTYEVDDTPVRCSRGEFMVNTNCGIWSLAPSSLGLNFFVISGDYFIEVMGQVSIELFWLRWFRIGQRNLPSGISLKKLRVLELYEDHTGYFFRDKLGGEHHLEQLWGETDGEAPLQLRELRISGCHKFQGFPTSIGRLSQLKKIVIINGYNLRSLPEEFCLLQLLEHLVLNTCEKLSSLPDNFGQLRNLRHLSLPFCSELRSLPDSFKNLMLLKYLNLRGCSELTFTSDMLENIRKLELLSLCECEQLEELPRHITNQASLRELCLEGTSLRELPVNIGQLSRLRELTIESVFLTSLPFSLGDLSSLTNLLIDGCPELEWLPDSLGDLSFLMNLSIKDCSKLKCLPDSLGNLSSLTNLLMKGCPELEWLPDSLGDLSSLMNLSIKDCSKPKYLPDSLGNLSSLTNLLIEDCSELKCLPDSLGNLSSLTNLSIDGCPKLERQGVKSLPKSIRQLNNLQWLTIFGCPISELEFGAASSNLKRIHLSGTEVCRISFSEDCCPNLENLCVYEHHHLEEIEALPRTVESIYLVNCEMLKKIPNFARLTSLRTFELEGSNRIEKIEGLENCTRLESLRVDSCWEVPGIESLKHMEKLSSVKLRANKGSAIQRCIQTIQKWPDEIEICMRVVVPDVSSVVDSLLSQNLVVVDSFSNQKMKYWPKVVQDSSTISSPKLVVQKPSSNGDVFMLCFVINCVSSQMRLQMSWHDSGSTFGYPSKFEKGRWAWVRVFTRPTQVAIYGHGEECDGENEVEKGMVVRGEKLTVVQAFHSLLTLLQG